MSESWRLCYRSVSSRACVKSCFVARCVSRSKLTLVAADCDMHRTTVLLCQ